MKTNKRLLYIDLFCGAGGTSTGVTEAKVDGYYCADVIACVNHDANAIASHSSNHPEALHFTEDIRTLELSPLVAHLKKCRKMNPEALVVLWASLECTNFSKAKGGQPRDADSRTLAEHLFRYIEALNPDYIQIENVEEFMAWGEMDETGHPISMDRGKCYQRWVANVKSYGYDFEHRILNAADYGAYTSRKRFFGIFAKEGLPIVFPEQTHSKDGKGTLFAPMKKWKPVKEVLDFSDEGVSIFGRKKPLSERTLERVYAGLIKFIAGGKKAFLSRYNTARPKDTALSMDGPCGVLTTSNRFALVQCYFLLKQFSGSPYSKNISVNQPAGTITTKDHHAFVTVYYGNGYNRGVNEPSPTVTTKDRIGLTSVNFIDMQYGNGNAASVECPANTLTTNPKLNLVSVKRPSPAITANQRWHYLMNPQFASAGSSVEDPCFTLIARMDKRPPYLVEAEPGQMAIEIYDSDSVMTVKIKQFMAMFGILDIKMRMLKISELKLIMGFPKDYVLVGTKADQKKYIGNAVEVNMARCLCEALCDRLSKMRLKEIA